MHPNKIHLIRAETPTVKTQSLKKGYGVYLSHSKGLKDMVIYGNNLSAATSLGPHKISSLGDQTETGGYVLPLHCHGENLLGGEEFAAAVLALAEKNENVTASLDGYMLTYTSLTDAALLPAGRIHGATGEIFSVILSISAPQSSGTSLSAGVGLTYTSGAQSIVFDCAVAGETVSVVGTSNASRQVTGLRITSTGASPRTIDIRSFGIYRGTVTEQAHKPYWGERVQIPLRAPLVHYSSAKDVTYPLRGYTERWVDCISVSDSPITAVELGAKYPTYRLEIPEQLRSIATMRLDHFSATTSTSTFNSYTYRYMRTPEGDAFHISASSTYNTLEKFTSFFKSLGVHIQIARKTALIEPFERVEIPTRQGLNYLDIETAVTPSTVDFTYY